MVDKSQKFIALVRLGYAARGLVYLLLGYLALSTAGETAGGGKAVFDWLQDVPLGTAVLWVVAVGLVGYTGFKFLSAVADVQHRGTDAMGIVKRIGDVASGCGYGFLAYAAYRFATGADTSANGDGGAQAMAAPVLGFELGGFIIGAIGIGFVVAAAMQARGAITAHFMRHVSARAPTGIEAVGRAGLAARAAVFAIIGWSLVRSAWFSQSSEVKGLGEALSELRDMGALYSLVAIGLLLFGVFSMVVARYRIIPDFGASGLKPSFAD